MWLNPNRWSLRRIRMLFFAPLLLLRYQNESLIAKKCLDWYVALILAIDHHLSAWSCCSSGWNLICHLIHQYSYYEKSKHDCIADFLEGLLFWICFRIPVGNFWRCRLHGLRRWLGLMRLRLIEPSLRLCRVAIAGLFEVDGLGLWCPVHLLQFLNLAALINFKLIYLLVIKSFIHIGLYYYKSIIYSL